MTSLDKFTTPCLGYTLDSGKWLPCRSALPFARGFKGSWVDACPGGCEGKGDITLIMDSKEFIQGYRSDLVNIGHSDPEWTDDDVEKAVRKLFSEEEYEDEEHIELVFARDLIYTLEQEVSCSCL